MLPAAIAGHSFYKVPGCRALGGEDREAARFQEANRDGIPLSLIGRLAHS